MRREISIVDSSILKGGHPVGWYNPTTKEIRWNNDQHAIMWMKESEKKEYEKRIRKEFEDFIE